MKEMKIWHEYRLTSSRNGAKKLAIRSSLKTARSDRKGNVHISRALNGLEVIESEDCKVTVRNKRNLTSTKEGFPDMKYR